MRRRRFETLASLMCIALLGSLPSISFAEDGKWTKKADMPTSRFGLSASVANGKIYAIGGWLSGGVMGSLVEVYDPLTDTWEQKANGPPLANAGFAEVNGKIYFGGGWAQLLATTYEYDPATNQWTRKTDMPTPRHLLSASVLGDKLYAIGGDVQADGGPSAVVEVYHPATDTWTKGAKMPTARGGLSTAVVQGKIYAIGGQTGVPWALGIVYPTVEEYTPADWSLAVSPRGKLATTWGKVKRGQ